MPKAAIAGIVMLLMHVSAVSQEALTSSILTQDDDWELVFAHCSACHSLQLVTSNRGDRDTWLRLIRWMQETHNLWMIEPTIEARLLDYLARNYGSEEPVRRAQLPAHLLPPR
jgi:hypothetical protein